MTLTCRASVVVLLVGLSLQAQADVVSLSGLPDMTDPLDAVQPVIRENSHFIGARARAEAKKRTSRSLGGNQSLPDVIHAEGSLVVMPGARVTGPIINAPVITAPRIRTP